MAQDIGEVSLKSAARIWGVHYNTALNWAAAAMAGERSKIQRKSLRRDLTRRLWVKESEVQRLLQQSLQEALSD